MTLRNASDQRPPRGWVPNLMAALASNLRGDPPVGTCPKHGDYWADYCPRCKP